MATLGPGCELQMHFTKCADSIFSASRTGLDITDVRFLTAAENFFEEKGGEHYITLFVTAFLDPSAQKGDELPDPQVCLQPFREMSDAC